LDEAGWGAQLVRLAAYKAEHGNCNVPKRWAEDPRLGKWVDKQRVRKRQLDHGEPTQGMTVERAARLTALGLVWELGHKGNGNKPYNKEWDAQLKRLAAYKAARGNCNVPCGWAEDPRLANWVNTQRMCKRKADRAMRVQPPGGARRAALFTLLLRGVVRQP
jgi:hypothetical protein